MPRAHPGSIHESVHVCAADARYLGGLAHRTFFEKHREILLERLPLEISVRHDKPSFRCWLNPKKKPGSWPGLMELCMGTLRARKLRSKRTNRRKGLRAACSVREGVANCSTAQNTIAP